MFSVVAVLGIDESLGRFHCTSLSPHALMESLMSGFDEVGRVCGSREASKDLADRYKRHSFISITELNGVKCFEQIHYFVAQKNARKVFHPFNSLLKSTIINDHRFQSFHVPLDYFCILNLNGVKERIRNKTFTRKFIV